MPTFSSFEAARGFSTVRTAWRAAIATASERGVLVAVDDGRLDFVVVADDQAGART